MADGIGKVLKITLNARAKVAEVNGKSVWQAKADGYSAVGNAESPELAFEALEKALKEPFKADPISPPLPEEIFIKTPTPPISDEVLDELNAALGDPPGEEPSAEELNEVLESLEDHQKEAKPQSPRAEREEKPKPKKPRGRPKKK